MKQILFLIIISLFTTAVAQVPDPNDEMMVPDIKPPQSPEESARYINYAGYYIQDGKYGFVYPKNTRQEAIYNNIKHGLDGFVVQIGKLYGLADNKGVLLSKIEYDSIGFLENNYLVKKNGKIGLLTNVGNHLLSIIYNKIIDINNFVTLVQNEKGDIQLVLNKTEQIFPQIMEYIDFYSNVSIVKTNGKFGVITDKIIVPFEYDSIYHKISNKENTFQKKTINTFKTINLNNSFVQDFVVVKKDKLGLINNEGMFMYPVDNDEIYRVITFGYYLIRKNNLNSIYFTSTKMKTAFEFSKVYTDGYGYVMAVKDNKSGVFNLKGKEIIPFEYDNSSISQYTGVGFKAAKNKKQGVIDSKGNVIVPFIYDDVNTLYSGYSTRFIQVKLKEKAGVVSLKGELIIPVEFQWISFEKDFFKVATLEPNRKIGLYDVKGNLVVPAEYQWISKSDTEESKIFVLKKEENSYNFLNHKNELILSENICEYGYVPNQNNLLNPFDNLLYVKNKKGKKGLLNQMTGKLDIPIVYDNITQRFNDEKYNYYSVQKEKKFGLINEKNEVIIPIKYNDINLDFVTFNQDENYQIVVAKGEKYGTVNLKNQVQIPFIYSELQRVSDIELYKVKLGKQKQYQIINAKNQPISNDLFDEVANFEEKDDPYYSGNPSYQALTFRNGKMRVIDDKGKYFTSETEMQPHRGFKSFDELKHALIIALESEEDELLKEFVDKIAPSDHLLFYLKINVFTRKTLDYIYIPYIKEEYLNKLMRFKYSYWKDKSESGFNRTSLTDVTDYTMYRDGYISNTRFTDQAFGNVKYLEKFLRNAIKVNGFWISSYFMKHYF